MARTKAVLGQGARLADYLSANLLARVVPPELVRQELYGWVLAHYAVRWLLHQGATRQRLAHAELSFKGHAQLLRRAQPRSGAFPPRAAATPAALVR